MTTLFLQKWYKRHDSYLNDLVCSTHLFREEFFKLSKMKKFCRLSLVVVLIFSFMLICNGQCGGIPPNCTSNDVGIKFPVYSQCEYYFECEERNSIAVKKHCPTIESNPPQQYIFDGIKLVCFGNFFLKSLLRVILNNIIICSNADLKASHNVLKSLLIVKKTHGIFSLFIKIKQNEIKISPI